MASGHLSVPHKQAEQMAAPTSTASPSKNPLPTGSRPQMAMKRLPREPPASVKEPLAADIGQIQTETGNASKDRRPQTVVFGAFQNPVQNCGPILR